MIWDGFPERIRGSGKISFRGFQEMIQNAINHWSRYYTTAFCFRYDNIIILDFTYLVHYYTNTNMKTNNSNIIKIKEYDVIIGKDYNIYLLCLCGSFVLMLVSLNQYNMNVL